MCLRPRARRGRNVHVIEASHVSGTGKDSVSLRPPEDGGNSSAEHGIFWLIAIWMADTSGDSKQFLVFVSPADGIWVITAYDRLNICITVSEEPLPTSSEQKFLELHNFVYKSLPLDYLGTAQMSPYFSNPLYAYLCTGFPSLCAHILSHSYTNPCKLWSSLLHSTDCLPFNHWNLSRPELGTRAFWGTSPTQVLGSAKFLFRYMCVRACVILCVGVGLTMAWFPPEGGLMDVYRIKYTSKHARPNTEGFGSNSSHKVK
jgi:hypothetical protein